MPLPPSSPSESSLTPWLGAEAGRWAACILASYRHWTGVDLLAGGAADSLYHHTEIVVAHDGAADPRFVYANRAAQALWGYSWSEFVGLPSRLSAPPELRAGRERLLDQGRAAGLVVARDLVRITSAGRRFHIAAVRLWTLRDQQAQPIGQAAAYGDWRWLE